LWGARLNLKMKRWHEREYEDETAEGVISGIMPSDENAMCTIQPSRPELISKGVLDIQNIY